MIGISPRKTAARPVLYESPTSSQARLNGATTDEDLICRACLRFFVELDSCWSITRRSVPRRVDHDVTS